MSKEEFIIELQNTLKKYEGKIVNEVLKDIRSDLDDVLNNYISDNVVMTEDFPIKFENGLGKWEIHKDGRTYVQPPTGRQFIECNITISPTGEINQNKEDEDVSIRKIVRCEDPMVCLRGCSVHEQTCKHPIYENQT